MKKKLIIGLVGQIASGKSTINKYLENKYQAKTLRFSTILRDILNRVYYPISRDSMQRMSTLLRKNFGEDVLSKVISEDAKKAKKNIISIDGVRRHADIKYLREIEGFVLIQIQADPKTRYERLVERNENKGDSDKTYEEFLTDGQKEADAEIPEVMKTADETIDNNENFNELYQQIDLLIKKYLETV